LSTSTGIPALPLTAEARASYEDLYDKNETAIRGTTDEALLQSFRVTQLNIGAVLSADNAAQLNADDAVFKDLLAKIGEADDGLTELQKKITAVAGWINKFSEVLTAIEKVRALVPML